MIELENELPVVAIFDGKRRIVLNKGASQGDIKQPHLMRSGSGFHDTLFHALDTTETSRIGHRSDLPR